MYNDFMRQTGRVNPPATPKADPFDERVDMLFDELAFSIRADRPSILLAPYASEFVRAEVEERLETRLAGIGQKTARMAVTEADFDMPLILSRRADRKKAVFSVVGLSQGGGKGGANAYRALNIRRELLVDHHLRALFWLTGAEARDLSRHAPDFWAFRHRVVEFNRPADINRLAFCGSERPLAALRAARKQARLFPEEAPRWLELGQLSLKVGLLQPARQAFLKGLALEPNNPAGWLGLAKVHRLGRNVSDAIINYRQVLSLEPQNISVHIALIACYRASGQMDLADEQMEAARRLAEHGNEYEQAALASVCGNATRAIEFLRAALEKQQTSLTEIRFDPDMDYLRNVPEFVQLLYFPSQGKAGGVKE